MAPRMKSNYPVILIGVILRKENMKRSHGDSLQNTTRKEGEHFAQGSVLGGGGGEGRVGESERLTEVNKHLIQGGAETRSMQFLSNRTLQRRIKSFTIVSCTKPQDLLLLICTLL